jgi:hypothetical protein
VEAASVLAPLDEAAIGREAGALGHGARAGYGADGRPRRADCASRSASRRRRSV